MNFNEIQDLIKLVNKYNLTEFKLKDKDFEVLIRTEKYQKQGIQTVFSNPQTMTAPAPQVSIAAATAAVAADLISPTPPTVYTAIKACAAVQIALSKISFCNLFIVPTFGKILSN